MPKFGSIILAIAILVFAIGLVIGVWTGDMSILIKSYAVCFLIAVIALIVGSIEIGLDR